MTKRKKKEEIELVNGCNLSSVVQSCLDCARWAENDLDTEKPLDDYPDKWSPEAVKIAEEDCRKFLLTDSAEDLITADDEQIGHDFWLTRKGHGSGFWDGDYEEAVGDRLTEVSNKFGDSIYPYRENGQLFFGGVNRSGR